MWEMRSTMDSKENTKELSCLWTTLDLGGGGDKTIPPLCYNRGMRDRLICEYPGCTNLGRNKGKYRNERIYDRFCDLHHRMRYDKAKQHFAFKLLIDNKKCKWCGWDKAPCDRHRIDPAKGYTKTNVIVLCPNCHRLAGNIY